MSNDSKERPQSWRRSASQSLTDEIDQAIAAFRYATAYETSAPTVRETAKALEKIATLSYELRALIEPPSVQNAYTTRLSKIGAGALYEASLEHGAEVGRSDLASFVEQLKALAEAASSAAVSVVNLYSPIPETGQGAGSSSGRDPDLRILRADHGLSSRIPPFRNPKDKLGVAVIKALVRFDVVENVLARGAIKEISWWLSRVWEKACPGRSTSWAAVISARGSIAALVRDQMASEEAWDLVIAEAEASSEIGGR